MNLPVQLLTEGSRGSHWLMPHGAAEPLSQLFPECLTHEKKQTVILSS